FGPALMPPPASRVAGWSIPRPLCGQDAVTGDGEDREGAVDSGAESPVRPPAQALKWPSTNRRIAEDRFPCWRLFSISLTKAESTVPRWAAISFMLVQKGSSRLTLVLWPHTTIERITTGDLIGILLSRADVNDDYHNTEPASRELVHIRSPSFENRARDAGLR